MAKLILDTIAKYDEISKINANFDKIEAEFQNKVLYRSNPTGEPNTVEGDVDFNNKRIINALSISASDVLVDGISVSDNVAAAATSASASAASASAAATSASQAAAAADFIPEIASYASLRAYSGILTKFYVKGVVNIFDGGAGVFRVDITDTTSADNGGTILVDATGRRWKREFSGAIHAEWFGAVGDWDGTSGTDNTTALQAWVAAIIAQPNGGEGVFGDGKFRITDEVNMYPSKPLKIRGSGNSSEIVIDFNGASKISLKFTHPTVPATRGKRIVLQDFRVSYGAGVTVPPVAIEQRKSTDLKMQRVEISNYRGGTSLRLSDLFNCDFHDVAVWGGGAHRARKQIPSGCTFTIAAGTTTLNASAAVFEASDAGHSILIEHGRGAQLYTIASFTSATEVQVAETCLVASTNAAGSFDGVRGTMTSGSATLTLNASVLTSDDVGRVVYVLGAKDATFPSAHKRPLRATITSVPAGDTATLDVAATASVSNVYVVISPAVEIFDDGEGTNDLVAYGLHVEDTRGACLVVDRAANLFLRDTKLHCQEVRGDDAASTFSGLFSAATGYVSGDFEGMPANNLGRIYVSGQSTGLFIDDWSGIAVDGQKLLAMGDCATAGAVTVGNVTIANQAAAATLVAPFAITGSGRLRTAGTISSYGVAVAQPERVFDGPITAQGTAAGLTMRGSASGSPSLEASGAAGAIPLIVKGKGGGVKLQQDANVILDAKAFGSSDTNYVSVTSRSGAVGPILTAESTTEADVDLNLRTKGAGKVSFGTRTASADAPITGYIEIKDASGTVRKLAVIG